MARQRITFQNFKSIVSAANVPLGLVILFGWLDGPAARLTNILGTAGREALNLAPYLVPGAWQASQAYFCDHQWFSACPLHLLVSSWPFLHVIAGAF